MKYISQNIELERIRKRFANLWVVLLFVFSLLLISCTPTETPPAAPVAESCTLGNTKNGSDDEMITQVLNGEGEFVVQQQIEPLMALWAEESSVIDAKNTPSDENDDQFWKGKDAVRHRYVRIVFPGAPASITPTDLQIEVDGDKATVQSTTNIGTETAKGGDHWQLVKQNGCWLLQNLTYNLESK